jgi:hypothetical protein
VNGPNYRALGWTLAASFVAVALLVALSEPALFLWYLAVGVVLWAVAASWMWAVWHDRAIHSESELLWLRPEVDALRAREDDTVAVPLFRPGKGTRAPGVPQQRSGGVS